MTPEEKEELLYDFYNFVMDEGTGTIREDDIITYMSQLDNVPNFNDAEDDS